MEIPLIERSDCSYIVDTCKGMNVVPYLLGVCWLLSPGNPWRISGCRAERVGESVQVDAPFDGPKFVAVHRWVRRLIALSLSPVKLHRAVWNGYLTKSTSDWGPLGGR